jgi:hypothetical protein
MNARTALLIIDVQRGLFDEAYERYSILTALWPPFL